jgi:hypothetical protein
MIQPMTFADGYWDSLADSKWSNIFISQIDRLC